MPQAIWRLAPAALLAAFMLVPAASAEERTPSAMPVEVVVPIAPTPVAVGGAPRLFYELHLASFAKHDVNVDEVEILNGDTGAVLSDDKGAALNTLIDHPGESKPPADPRRMTAGSIAILFMETTLAAGPPPPDSLRWRLRFSRVAPADPGQPELPPIEGLSPIASQAPITLGYPLPAGKWVAANGPSNTSGHRRSLQVVDGRARIAQRFAIDWVKLGPNGRLFHGDKAANANWYGFGTGVLAVADATVSAAHDGVPENEPSDKRAVPITLETIGGNYLILDLGAGRYAFYAHLQPGSQRVRVGDKVHRGEVIALLGNTGNSDAPHLHFHVSNANNPLGAEGVPYVFAAYRSLGKANDQITGPQGWRPDPAMLPTVRRNALPAEDEVVEIP
jgi:murein DD-endopeptidase MepM/ murein hydrolase activator NlpD